MIPRRKREDDGRRSAVRTETELNGLVTHRRKPRWQRQRVAPDRARKDEDPGVGIEQDLEREVP